MKIVNLRDRVGACAAYHCNPARAIQSFRRDQGGAILVFGLILFVLMLAVGGMAVDLMRHERLRTEVQQTLDRSVLNAAGLSQKLDAELVVTDSFEKAGLSAMLKSVDVQQGLNFRKVSAVAIGETKTFVMDMMGIKTLAAAASSTAEQQINNVEVVLVLDVSGSMGEPSGDTSKIAALKEAATKFIDDVLDADGGNRVTISIVPYNAQVNLGEKLRQQYKLTKLHGIPDINCIELTAADFSNLNISRTKTYEMFSWADPSGNTSTANAFVSPTSTSTSSGATNNLASNWASPIQDCNKTLVPNSNIVRLPSADPVALKGYINGLAHGGRTSITLGMKWGAALIDPGARPMFEDLVASGDIADPEHAVRPFDYSDEDALKYIVLMTDGIHVAHNTVNPNFKTGLSPIYFSSGDGNYSIQHAVADLPPAAAGKRFWVPHLVPATTSNMANGWQTAAWDSGAGVKQLTWPEVWTKLRVSYVGWQMYARALGRANGTVTAAQDRAAKYEYWYGDTNAKGGLLKSRWADAMAMDSSLQQTCDLVKAINFGDSEKHTVQIFGIAFQAPAAAGEQIKKCASDQSYFKADDDVDIKKAFSVIASQITYLRLTQ
jgi:Flp pilus assembly protein TadG